MLLTNTRLTQIENGSGSIDYLTHHFKRGPQDASGWWTVPMNWLIVQRRDMEGHHSSLSLKYRIISFSYRYCPPPRWFSSNPERIIIVIKHPLQLRHCIYPSRRFIWRGCTVDWSFASMFAPAPGTAAITVGFPSNRTLSLYSIQWIFIVLSSTDNGAKSSYYIRSDTSRLNSILWSLPVNNTYKNCLKLVLPIVASLAIFNVAYVSVKILCYIDVSKMYVIVAYYMYVLHMCAR